MKLFCFLLLFTIPISAQEIRVIKWETKHASPPTQLERTNPKFATLLRFGVSNIPEPIIMQFAGIGGAKLGLNKVQANTLQKSIASYYQKMAKQRNAGDFPSIPSALEYCYSKDKSSHGFATIYQPKNLTKETPTILFLHGYGGSFSYYLHYLAETFPNHLIVCPAYGISMGRVPDSYLSECKSAVEKLLKINLKKPTLIGLSAGGYGGFWHYSKNIDSYNRFICIASLPHFMMDKPLAQNAIIRLIAGGNEGYVENKQLDKRIKKLKLTNYRQVILPDQGHFFMLTDAQKTRATLKKMISD